MRAARQPIPALKMVRPAFPLRTLFAFPIPNDPTACSQTEAELRESLGDGGNARSITTGRKDAALPSFRRRMGCPQEILLGGWVGQNMLDDRSLQITTRGRLGAAIVHRIRRFRSLVSDGAFSATRFFGRGL